MRKYNIPAYASPGAFLIYGMLASAHFEALGFLWAGIIWSGGMSAFMLYFTFKGLKNNRSQV